MLNGFVKINTLQSLARYRVHMAITAVLTLLQEQIPNKNHLHLGSKKKKQTKLSVCVGY